ncbi:hypothetical protein [Proteiniphilum acetatigenes]|uniref:hypothetical protein n=1 Tax=Proteiniphilum acetatigenes TaxID=294710 RepID=UPI00036BFD24|nr:hypothetical protein [Proteiniphilum acetatigenes]
MPSISIAFATALSEKLEQKRPLLRSARTARVHKIVQLNPFPETLDLKRYREPISSYNPEGDYGPAILLSALANRIPSVTPFFEDSGNSLTNVWNSLLHAAMPQSKEDSYTQRVLTQARENFTLSKKSGRAGFPDDWYLVETDPYNWYDLLSDKANLIHLDIDLQKNDREENGSMEFLTINGVQSLTWNILGNDGKWKPVPVQPGTEIQKIQMDVLLVNFTRKWMNYDVFSTQWKINGLKKGFYSSGELTENEGIFPLVVESMLVATHTIVDGIIDKKDQMVLAQSPSVSLGGFVLNDAPRAHIAGYISRLIPVAPALE